jgi:hypothetical protein
MNRKPTRQSRGPNAEEKRFHGFTKEASCIACGNPGPSIVHHCEGSTFKNNKVLVGHYFVLPLCELCDTVITNGSKKAFRAEFGPQSELWGRHIERSGFKPPGEVSAAVESWGR